jgi:phospholipase/carboxylesterase
MSYTTQESAENIVLNPSATPAAAVIWLHGLGADGFDFVPIVEELRLPATLPVRFLFPHAGTRPITINNGFVMRAWYDITSLGGARTTEDEAGIRESEGVVRGYIEQQIESGIAADRIIIAGFSQGGAIALQTALRYPRRLGGVMALSTYLPLRQTLAKEADAANRDVPILMCHGSYDPMVPLALGEASREALQGLGYGVDWRTYPMQHQVCMEEIADVSAWLQARLTRNI